jgi:hypothetical protein
LTDPGFPCPALLDAYISHAELWPYRCLGIMTFNELHDSIENGCDCLTQTPLVETTKDEFVRAIDKSVVSTDDFKSHLELGRPLRAPIKSCRMACEYRGLSVNKLDNNAAAIKAFWEAVGMISPKARKGKRFVCAFRLNAGAGIVWDTSHSQPQAHHTILKADGFNANTGITVSQIIPIAKF